MCRAKSVVFFPKRKQKNEDFEFAFARSCGSYDYKQEATHLKGCSQIRRLKSIPEKQLKHKLKVLLPELSVQD